ncbi:hypothetical protein BJY52DRAFT_252813 [Lactarius psammicola]|nr:hypothetical protein BJY52DRAFT_252813 [Lactarius psammicola]
MTGRHFDEGVRSCSSPSTASSHGEGHAADTEMDAAGPSGASGAENTRQTGKRRRESDPPPAQPPPAKKKRTRTLTTPHQSAVLHALLAQSRFPTTAMREEVGRSIGLSARKVQVWFQNQRQKARRPRNQGSDPLTRPPQYGAFPNVLSLGPPDGGPSSFPLSEGQSPFYMAPPPPFLRFNAAQDSPSREDAIGSSVTGTRTSPVGHLSGPGVPGASSSLAPRFLPPSPASHPPHPWPSTNDGHPGAPLLAAATMPSREFTFSLPFPPLHVPEVSASTSSHFAQTRFPPPPPNHHPVATSSPPRLTLSAGGEALLPPPPFATESRPPTPGSFLAPPRGLEPTRDLPRAHRIPPLHVPDTPHVHPHARQRPALPLSPPRGPRHAQSFPLHPAERAVLSATSGSSRGGSPPVSVRSRARRFDPVREAASERSGSQGTDVSTPPRPDTPHV